MTDRIETALRAGPPDEPRYNPNIETMLREEAPTRLDSIPTPTLIELTPRSEPVRRGWGVVTLVAAAAACVAAIATVAIVRDPSPSPADAPTTTTASTSVTTATGPKADGPLAPLEGRWVGRATSSSDGSAADRAFLVVRSGTIAIERNVGGIVNNFVSDLREPTGDGFQATLTDQVGRCARGATGNYSWSLSPGRSVLTISVVDDACGARGEAFSNTWTRIACPTRGSDCLGPLEAGRHDSVEFDPFGTGAFAQVSYEVPAGWSSPLDDRARLALQPGDGTVTDRHGVFLFADVAAPDGVCSTVPGPQSGADAVTAAISSALQGTGATATSTETQVGGFPARVVDITPGAQATCATGSIPLLIARPDSPIAWTVTATSQPTRILLVDLPDDRTMAIVVASDRSHDEYLALLDAAAEMITSLTFAPSS